MFKKCYVINLDRRKDRYNEFLSRTPFDCERFSAIDGKNINNYKIDENPYIIGCHLSHKKILEMVSNNNEIEDDDLILIFEDDVFFNNSFKDEIIKLNKMLFKENNNFILYIGGRFTKNFKPQSLKGWNLIYDKIYEKLDNNISSHDFDRTTNVLILSKYTCSQIINKTKDIKTSVPIDSLYNNIKQYIPEIKIYDFFPHLCYSPVNYQTDIQNYKKIIK